MKNKFKDYSGYTKSELSFQRRLEIYKAALQFIYDEIDTDGFYQFGLCSALKRSTFNGAEPNPYYTMHINYPEIYAYKPKNIKKWDSSEYWWSINDKGTQKRLNVLHEVINGMEAIIAQKENNNS